MDCVGFGACGKHVPHAWTSERWRWETCHRMHGQASAGGGPPKPVSTVARVVDGVGQQLVVRTDAGPGLAQAVQQHGVRSPTREGMVREDTT